MSAMSFIVVFDSVLSRARVARIKRAIAKVDKDAFVVRGWTEPSYQPGYVGIDVFCDDQTRRELFDAACKS